MSASTMDITMNDTASDCKSDSKDSCLNESAEEEQLIPVHS